MNVNKYRAPGRVSITLGSSRVHGFAYLADHLPGWVVVGSYRERATGVTIESLEVKPQPHDDPEPGIPAAPAPRHGITRAVLDDIPTDEIRTLIANDLDRVRASFTRPEVGVFPHEVLHAYTALAQGPNASKRLYRSDDFLRRVAEAWVHEVTNGPGAYKRMTEHRDLVTRDGTQPSVETVRKWVSTARKEGWLAGAERGRTHAEPGPKLQAYRIEKGE